MTFEEFSFPPEFEAYKEHQGRFPPESANGPVSEVINQNEYNNESDFSFSPLEDTVLVQGTGGNQTFQQPASNARFYQRNNRRNDGPFTSSIPPNNFNTPPHPNASNVPNASRDAPEYRQSNHSSGNGQQNFQQDTQKNNQDVQRSQNVQSTQETNRGRTGNNTVNNEELKKLGQSVTEEMRKIKISLPLFELLKIAEVRDTFLNNLKDNKPQGSQTQSTVTHTQGRSPPNSVHVIQDALGANMTNSPQEISYGEGENPTQEVAYGDISSFNGQLGPQPIYVAQGLTPIEQQTQKSQNPVNNKEKVKKEEITQTIDFGVKPKQACKTPVVYYQGKEEPAPFLLSVRMFGKLLHNCLIDSGASSNVMPLNICRRLGITPLDSNRRVTQLDKTEIPVVGELHNIHMQLASDPRMEHMVDISVVDVADTYGLILGRDWARKLNGYMATDFSHMWLPWKGLANQIRIDSTPRLRLTVTENGESNEILFVETNMSTYRPKKVEVLTMNIISKGRDSTEILIESDPDASSDEGEGMFENFKNFVTRTVQQGMELGNRTPVRDLLLPNWCRIHNAFHSELSCSLCTVALEQVEKRIPGALKREDQHGKQKVEIQQVDEAGSNMMGETKNQITPPSAEIKEDDEINESESLQKEKHLERNEVWTLRFDGSKTKQGAGAGFELVSPTGTTYLEAHRLQFSCTNNVAEYEALILGLLCAIKKGAKILHVLGDSYLIIEQIKQKFACYDKRLKRYRNRVWDLIEDFDAFNIKFSYRANNQVANALAQTASSLAPIKLDGLKKFRVELALVPSVPDNVKNFQVFEDDRHILKFLTNSDVFTAQIIDGEVDEEAEIDAEGIMSLKENTIPKGIIELERIFDMDQFHKMQYQPTGGDECEKVNLGTEDCPKIVHIGKVCTPKEKADILSLMKEFPDVIAWGYGDLKTYDPSIITHTIPLKEGSKPFRQR